MRVLSLLMLLVLFISAVSASRCEASCVRLRRCPYYPTRSGEIRVIRTNKSCANCLNNCNGLGRGVWGR